MSEITEALFIALMIFDAIAPGNSQRICDLATLGMPNGVRIYHVAFVQLCLA